MSVPLIILCFGSIFIGYLTRDAIIGVGSDFFSNAIFTGPNFYNFEDEYNNLINCNGAKVIYDYGDLSIINDNVTIKEMGLNSKNYSYSVGGSANKVASKIVGLLNEN